MPRLPAAAIVLASCVGGARPTPTAAPAPAQPAAVRYEPGTLRYRVVQHRHVEQVFQGQALTTDLATRVALTVALARRDTGLAVTFLIDSISLEGGPVFPAEAVAGARGAQFDGILMPGGVLAELGGGDSANPLLQQIAFLLQDFFPGTPTAGVTAGARWTDTTDDRGTSGAADVRVRSINTRSSSAWTTFADLPALEILTDATLEISGSGAQAGQAFTVAGTGRGHGRHYLSTDGRLMGGSHADTVTMQIELSGTGITIPVTQWTTDTLRAAS
jgi:hypothetical protein